MSKKIEDNLIEIYIYVSLHYMTAVLPWSQDGAAAAAAAAARRVVGMTTARNSGGPGRWMRTPQTTAAGPSAEAGPCAVPSAGPLAVPSAGPRADPSAGPLADPSAGPLADPSAGPLADPADPSAGPAEGGEPSLGAGTSYTRRRSPPGNP